MRTRGQKSANKCVKLTSMPSDVGATHSPTTLRQQTPARPAKSALSSVRHAAPTTTSELASENPTLPT
eukprot:5773760-Prorocentrum_lima.AAC.1